MAKNDSTCTFRVEESEIREYLDKQVREAVKQVLEEIMNAEAEELICAGPYERSESRRDHRRRDQEAQDQDQGGGVNNGFDCHLFNEIKCPLFDGSTRLQRVDR